MRNGIAAVALLSLGSLITGCAHEFAGTGSQQVGIRAGTVNGVQASLFNTGLYGPNVAVQRGNLFYRGTLLNKTVDLGWNREQVFGMVDSAPTALKWAPEGDGLRISGMYGGKLSNLKVTTQGIEGNIGECGYSLVADRRGYRGHSICHGGLDQEAEVVLPQDLGARSEGEQVALLAMILSGTDRALNDLARTGEEAGPGVDYYWKGGDPRESGAPYSTINDFQ